MLRGPGAGERAKRGAVARQARGGHNAAMAPASELSPVAEFARPGQLVVVGDQREQGLAPLRRREQRAKEAVGVVPAREFGDGREF